MRKVKIGLVGVMQHNFIGNKEEQFKNGIDGLAALADEYDFDFIFYPELLVTSEDAQRATCFMKEKNIDFLLVQSSSFAAGEVILPLAKMNAFLGLWAVPEKQNTGVLELNSFCCVNMFAGIITHYLKEYRKKYKWFFGAAGSDMFRERFVRTIKALKVICNLRESKVALVGGIAPGFNDLYFDERTIEKKLGVTVQRGHEFSEIKNRALAYKTAQLTDEMNTVASGYTCISSSIENNIELNARVYKAYKDFAQENNYSALAISCWPKIQDELNFLACSTLAKLNQNGIPAACEGDLPGAISMLMLNLIDQTTTMLMDLVAFEEQDDSVQLWHCGPAAECFADRSGVELGEFYENGGKEQKYLRRGSVHNMTFKAQDATIMRITDECQSMFLAHGTFMDGKEGFFGSSGWLTNIHLADQKISAKDLINTILVTGFQHHYPVVSGIVCDIMLEIAAWLDLEPVEAVPYRAYLQTP